MESLQLVNMSKEWFNMKSTYYPAVKDELVYFLVKDGLYSKSDLTYTTNIDEGMHFKSKKLAAFFKQKGEKIVSFRKITSTSYVEV